MSRQQTHNRDIKHKHTHTPLWGPDSTAHNDQASWFGSLLVYIVYSVMLFCVLVTHCEIRTKFPLKRVKGKQKICNIISPKITMLFLVIRHCTYNTISTVLLKYTSTYLMHGLIRRMIPRTRCSFCSRVDRPFSCFASWGSSFAVALSTKSWTVSKNAGKRQKNVMKIK